MPTFRQFVAFLAVLIYATIFTLCQEICSPDITITMVTSDLQIIVTTVDSEPVSFTCDSVYNVEALRNNFFRTTLWRTICQNAEILSNVTHFWEINGTGRYLTTNDLPREYIQQGIDISSNCTDFNFTELFETCTAFLLDQDKSDNCSLQRPGNSRLRCRNQRTIALLPYCQTNITVPATVANNNTEYRCGSAACYGRTQWADTTRTMTIIRVGRLLIQGSLAAPPNFQLYRYTIYNGSDSPEDETLLLAWDAPYTMPGIPISYYQVKINNFVDLTVTNVSSNADNQLMLDENSTSIDIETLGAFRFVYTPGCESIEFGVSAWNAVGKGETNTVVFSQASLQDVIIYTPDNIQNAICILCVFSNNSRALGCHVTLTQTQSSMVNSTTIMESFNISRKTSQLESNTHLKLDAFKCVTAVPGNYTILVREIECTGGIGRMEFLQSAMISISLSSTYDIPTAKLVTEVPQEFEVNNTCSFKGENNATMLGLASSTAVLLAVVFVLILGIVLVGCVTSHKRRGKASLHNSSKRKENDCDLQLQPSSNPVGTAPATLAYELQSTPIYDTCTTENYYDNTYTVSGDLGYGLSERENSVPELKPCIAYNTFQKK